MEYGQFYSIYQLAEATRKYLDLLNKINISFFNKKELPFDRREIRCAIQVGANLKADQVPTVSHPAVNDAITDINDFIERYNSKIEIEEIDFFSFQLYTNIDFLVKSLISLINNSFEMKIDKVIVDLNDDYFSGIKYLLKYKQERKFEKTHTNKNTNFFNAYLDNKIKDLKELIEIDKLQFGTEIKEILKSYKLGLEINVNGKNLISPLLEKQYDKFKANLKESLLIPSYFDITKKDKESYNHIYLLGVLEGRLTFYNLKSNRESGFGRYDICAIPINNNNPGIIIEVKSDKNVSNEEALEQIENNEYQNELKSYGVKEILFLAINFLQRDIKMEYKVVKI